MGPIGSTMALMLKLTALPLSASSSDGGAHGGGLAFGGVLDRLWLSGISGSVLVIDLVQ